MKSTNREGIPMSIFKRFSYILSVIAFVVSCISLGVSLHAHREPQAVRDQIKDREVTLHYTLPDGTVINMPRSEGAPYDDPNPLECSQITYAGKNVNSTIEFAVPEGWSVWRCISERFPHWDAADVVGAVDYFNGEIERNPAATSVRDLNVVPIGFSFVMGGDGAGPKLR